MKHIFIRETSVRFTKCKVYDLLSCSIRQANSCDVIDDNGIKIVFTTDKDYWLSVS